MGIKTGDFVSGFGQATPSLTRKQTQRGRKGSSNESIQPPLSFRGNTIFAIPSFVKANS